MVTVALYGHATIVAMQKIVVPVVGGLLILGVFAFAGGFHPSATSGEYALGGFWPTWTLCAVLFAAAPISYGPTIGDYTRRISAVRFSDRQITVALGVGMFIGVLLPSLFGAYTAMSFANPTDSYLDDLVTAAPTWYVLPIVVISVLGGLSQGVLCIYASGLDLEGLAPQLKRTQTTIITAAVAIVLLYVGVFVFDAVGSVTAMTVVLNAVITPWVAVLAIGALRTRKRRLRPGRPAGLRPWAARRPLLVHRRLEHPRGAGLGGRFAVRRAGGQHHALRRSAGRHRRRGRPEHHRFGGDRRRRLRGGGPRSRSPG